MHRKKNVSQSEIAQVTKMCFEEAQSDLDDGSNFLTTTFSGAVTASLEEARKTKLNEPLLITSQKRLKTSQGFVKKPSVKNE